MDLLFTIAWNTHFMASAHADPDSALYAPCTAMRTAGVRLLLRAQAEGTARFSRADISPASRATCRPNIVLM